MASKEHADAVFTALKAYDDAVADCVRDELRALLPDYELAEEAAALRLNQAFTALELPQKHLAEAEAELERIRGIHADWSNQVANGSTSEDRVQSRVWTDQWSAEIKALENRVDQLKDALVPFEHEQVTARQALADATMRKQALKYNADNAPFWALGQTCDSYKAMRIGSHSMWETLITNNVNHPEFEAFFESLDGMAAACNYDTEGLKERLRIQAIAETRRNFARTPEKAPSAGDVIAGLTTGMQNQQSEKYARESTSSFEATTREIDRVIASPTTRNEDFRTVPGRGKG